MVKGLFSVGRWLLEKAGLLPRTPRTTRYLVAEDEIRFVHRSRRWIRNVINAGRPTNAQGGLNWTREEFIAYALARPLPGRWPGPCGVDWRPLSAETALRTARFRRHEMFANDNINYAALATCLWQCELVAVNSKTCGDNDIYPPLSLVRFCEQIAPWLPKPPNEPRRAAA